MKIGRTIAEKDTASKNRVDYYPFGLEMAHSWEQLPNSLANAYRYNAGSEKNDLTGNYETLFRQYDPAIGRMLAVDPVAAKYSSVTPYNYAFNDPVFWNDPSGADPDWNYTGDYIDQYENDIIYRDHGAAYVQGHGGPALSMLNGISAMMNGGNVYHGERGASIVPGGAGDWANGMHMARDYAVMGSGSFSSTWGEAGQRYARAIQIHHAIRHGLSSTTGGGNWNSTSGYSDFNSWSEGKAAGLAYWDRHGVNEAETFYGRQQRKRLIYDTFNFDPVIASQLNFNAANALANEPIWLWALRRRIGGSFMDVANGVNSVFISAIDITSQQAKYLKYWGPEALDGALGSADKLSRRLSYLNFGIATTKAIENPSAGNQFDAVLGGIGIFVPFVGLGHSAGDIISTGINGKDLGQNIDSYHWIYIAGLPGTYIPIAEKRN